MTKEGELEVNDIIEVRRMRYLKDDQWIPARVTYVDDRKIEVQALRGTFDGTHDLEALPRNQQPGRFWR
jgi:hypothetical protein